MSDNFVYLTVLTSKDYIPGVKGLKISLFKTKTKYNLVILVPEEMRNELEPLLKKRKILNDRCILETEKNLNILLPDSFTYKNHYFKNTFFKLQAYKCNKYKKIVLLDSDMMILKNIDNLFEKNDISASRADSIRHPEMTDFFSSILVIEPSQSSYTKLIECLKDRIEIAININYKVGDQDVFNFAFKDRWINNKELHIPENYNSCFYETKKLCKKMNWKYKDIKVLHFYGSNKPWKYNLFSKSNLYLLKRMLLNGELRLIVWFIKYYFLCK